MSTDGKITIALAGIGGYGDVYLDALMHDPRAAGGRLVGVIEPMPHRCRRLDVLRERGIGVYPTLEVLFDSAAVPVDLVMIAAPIHFHAPLTCSALRHGANVLCEKPLAGTLADGLRMGAAERASGGRFVGIGYQWSYSDAVQALKRDVLAGVLGRPVRMKTIALFPRARSYFGRNDWAGRIRTAGGAGVLDSPANNAAAHYLHNMLYLLGPTREQSAVPASVQAELYRANDIENYDTIALRALTADGTEVLFYSSHAVPVRQGPVCTLEFERATVEYDAGGSGSFVARFRDGRVREYGDPNLDRNRKIWDAIDASRTGAPMACGIQAALAHTACVVAAQGSVPEVHPLPQPMRKMVEVDGEVIVCIDGLARTLLDCYARSVLTAEYDHLPWARPGTRVDVAAPAADEERVSRAGACVAGGGN